jgi:transposase-like protein
MFRKVVSLTSFLSLVVTVVTSVVLYVVPQGRVAYWADWTLLGLSKDQWGNIHLTVGTLFLVALLLHLWLNWTPLTAYMKDRARRMVVMTFPMMVSVLITLYVVAGTIFGLPPMRQLIDFGASVKDAAIMTYGNPPYGHAELSPLKKFCGYLGFDVDAALVALRAAGYDASITADTEVREIARLHGVSPQQVYNDIRAALAGDPFAVLPPSPPEGTGKLTLDALCASFGLPVDEAMARLGRKSIHARPEMTLREIGRENAMNPLDIYNALRGE